MTDTLPPATVHLPSAAQDPQPPPASDSLSALDLPPLHENDATRARTDEVDTREVQSTRPGGMPQSPMYRLSTFAKGHPLAAIAAAAAVGAVGAAALYVLARPQAAARPVPGSRSALARRQALLDEVHDTTQAILRILNERLGA